MNISELCKSEVCSISQDQSINQAAKLMKEKNIGSIVVVADNKPVGIVTDRDIALKLADETSLENLKISDVMCKDIFVLKEDQDLMEAVNAMKNQKIRRAPVVSKEGNLCGIVSVDDLLIYMAQGLSCLTDLIESQVERKSA